MIIDKAIILAGGNATRLYPITKVISKHLLPIYDKPMIYYPISTLMIAGIKNFLIITSSDQLHFYKDLLNDGSQWGINITFKTQKKPKGIPEAFKIGEDFIGDDPICLNLGDHILFGHSLKKILVKNLQNFKKNTIFSVKSNNPSDYGVINLSKNGIPLSIKEKPKNPKTNQIICGLYLYDNKIIQHAKKIKLSKRNEYEISEINQNLILKNDLQVEKLKKNIYWFDAGNVSRLLEISNLIKNLTKKNIYVGYLEKTALLNSFINKKQFNYQIQKYDNTEYVNNIKLIKNSNENF